MNVHNNKMGAKGDRKVTTYKILIYRIPPKISNTFLLIFGYKKNPVKTSILKISEI